ncbi:hypothetical protein P154DRAFT_115252 [Amniculicola lignicola CBS 123094]|uniref:Uncharacterized protein n=1 Tax=Amniculicola lignicola CBS 123094 TaxID=1392246 RepID=A0A6A5WZS8_9PLEO|nr:hypothetical protein P154DRAFT_115252 [Amniculicola lignicola CBS 123094]
MVHLGRSLLLHSHSLPATTLKSFPVSLASRRTRLLRAAANPACSIHCLGLRATYLCGRPGRSEDAGLIPTNFLDPGSTLTIWTFRCHWNSFSPIFVLPIVTPAIGFSLIIPGHLQSLEELIQTIVIARSGILAFPSCLGDLLATFSNHRRTR